MREAMELVKASGSFISAHCEDESLLEGGAIHKGEYAALHGMKGISSASEYVPIERDIRLAAETGVQYHICHISACESIEAVRRGKAAGIPVTCEVTPHHIALTDMDITEDNGRFKMNPPLRGREDREAIWAGLQDGTIDCIVTDHAPHTAQEKALPLTEAPSGMVGLETALAITLTELYHTGKMSLSDVIGKLTAQPAAILGLNGGRLALGGDADLVIFDPNETWTIDPERFVSKGRNTPFGGREVKGKVKYTIVGGKIIYKG
jgi:dihydroorotase